MAPNRKFDPMSLVDPDRAAKQAKLNKQRADRMERDVAAYLTKGSLQIARMTPQSGAGWIKGDNHVPLPTPPHFFLISCKMSQAQTTDNRAYINFSTDWVIELKRDVKAMRSIGCKFGIIVLRWFGRARGELIALVDKTDLPLIEQTINLKLKVNDLTFDKSLKKGGSPLKISKLFREYALENINSTFKVHGAEFVIIHLSTIHKALIETDQILLEESL